jgi:hypothetical protein
MEHLELAPQVRARAVEHGMKMMALAMAARK